MSPSADLDVLEAELAELRSRIDHAEAPHNPDALQAVRIAEDMLAELRGAGEFVKVVRQLAEWIREMTT